MAQVFQSRSAASSRLVWLAIGVLVGSLGSGLLPHAPLYASATHSTENFVIATGDIDDGIEGIYILDLLTGELKGMVLNTGTRMFTTFYQYNIMKDFEATKNPKFLMVTGIADMRRGTAKFRMGRSAIYIADVNSGTVAAYGVPWDSTRAAQGAPLQATFIPLDKKQVRTVQLRQTQ